MCRFSEQYFVGIHTLVTHRELSTSARKKRSHLTFRFCFTLRAFGRLLWLLLDKERSRHVDCVVGKSLEAKRYYERALRRVRVCNHLCNIITALPENVLLTSDVIDNSDLFNCVVIVQSLPGKLS